MITVAGWKLWNRKPSEAPAVSAASTAAPGDVEVKCDDREGDAVDRTQPGRQPVDAV